jgi:hypothetical protein
VRYAETRAERRVTAFPLAAEEQSAGAASARRRAQSHAPRSLLLAINVATLLTFHRRALNPDPLPPISCSPSTSADAHAINAMVDGRIGLRSTRDLDEALLRWEHKNSPSPPLPKPLYPSLPPLLLGSFHPHAYNES